MKGAMISAVSTNLQSEVASELAVSAAERNAALDACGFADSILWLRLEAPACAYCGEPIRRGAVKRGNCMACPACNEAHPVDNDEQRMGSDPYGPLDGVEPR